MNAVLQAGNRTIAAEEIIPLLTKYQMLPQLLRESIIDQAIALIKCTPEETARACQYFYQQNQLTSETEQQAWLERHSMTLEDLEDLATRNLRIEMFKQENWGHRLEAYFLKLRGKLDKIIYSLIRTKDAGVARELYFRAQEGEQPFTELAQAYSQGPEAQTGGLVGPIEMSNLHPNLAQILRASQSGRLLPPSRLGEWFVVVRLEKLLPARLDKPMRRRLLNELFEAWLQEQLK
jgi:parvulin-like peptidyl-prolyl isomerase